MPLVSLALDNLIVQLGYQFKTPALLAQALTHRSFSGNNNERLEFLGDSIIGAIVSNYLFKKR